MAQHTHVANFFNTKGVTKMKNFLEYLGVAVMALILAMMFVYGWSI